jgi:hypothetical protein
MDRHEERKPLGAGVRRSFWSLSVEERAALYAAAQARVEEAAQDIIKNWKPSEAAPRDWFQRDRDEYVEEMSIGGLTYHEPEQSSEISSKR